MDNWVKQYATKERARRAFVNNHALLFVRSLMEQIQADIATFGEDFPNHRITVNAERGIVHRDFGSDDTADVRVGLDKQQGKITWEYKGILQGGHYHVILPNDTATSESSV